MKTLLHVGCGPKSKDELKGFDSGEWQEIRFDIDPAVSPDIVGTLTDMSGVKSESMDAVFSSHNIEHLFPHEVPVALSEFYRVLKRDGIVIITCPDLVSVCQKIVSDRLLEPLYETPTGPISPIDVLYGHRGLIAKGNHYMAHKSGFTFSVLRDCFFSAGFKIGFGGSRPQAFDMWLMACKSVRPDNEIAKLASIYLP
jgi:SAM-dependent methyltransferase